MVKSGYNLGYSLNKEDVKEYFRKRKWKLIGIGALIASMVTWYSLTNNPDRFNSDAIKENKAPAIVQTIDNKVEGIFNAENSRAELPEIINTVNGPIKTDEIDFSGYFEIKTERYRLVKYDDFAFSRVVGLVGSLPAKLFFWNYNVSKGLDAEKTKDILAILENDKSIEGITVRVNHTDALGDLGRLFKDPKVKERNPFAARFLLGLPSWLFREMLAELVRPDYYNPLTNTAIVYSNVEGIFAHEIGHHKDFHRFQRDWPYALLNIVPGGSLYQEARASLYSKDNLSPEENYQFYRFLIPAYGTYIYATYRSIRNLVNKIKGKDDKKKPKYRLYTAIPSGKLAEEFLEDLNSYTRDNKNNHSRY